MKRKPLMTGDQWLLVLDMATITALVMVGLLVMAYAPNARSETVIPLISLGVTALISLAGKPSFPVPSPTQEAAPAGAAPAPEPAPAAAADKPGDEQAS